MHFWRASFDIDSSQKCKFCTQKLLCGVNQRMETGYKLRPTSELHFNKTLSTLKSSSRHKNASDSLVLSLRVSLSPLLHV